MKRTTRLLIALACGAVVAAFTAAPAAGVATGSYAATADGAALTLAIFEPGAEEPAGSFDIGITHGELDSTPTAAGSAAGIVQADVATTNAPPDDSQTVSIADETIEIPDLATLAFDLAKGTSESITSTGPTATNRGELLGAVLTVAPGGTSLVGTPPFAAASDANIATTATTVTSEGHSDEVVLPVQVGVEVIGPLCEPLGSISEELGQACQEAVEGAGEGLVTVAEVDILPADVQCVLDQTTNTASVPVAQAALLTITLFPGTVNEEVISVSVGQTIDVGEGTPLHIHAVVSDAASAVEGATASATATGLRLDLLDEPLPTISVVASEVACTVTGEAAKVLPPAPPPPPEELPVTGAPLGLIYAGGGLMLLVALGLVRFLRKAAA